MPVNQKLINRVATTFLKMAAPYTPSTDMERVVGKFVSQEYGITDAPEAFFDAVDGRIEELLSEEGLELDLKNTEVYPLIRQAIAAVVDEMGMLEAE